MADETSESQDTGGNETDYAKQWKGDRLTARQQTMLEARKRRSQKSSSEGESIVEQAVRFWKIGSWLSSLTIIGIFWLHLRWILRNGFNIRWSFIPPMSPIEKYFLIIVDILLIIVLIFLGAYWGTIAYAAACLIGLYDSAKCAWSSL